MGRRVAWRAFGRGQQAALLYLNQFVQRRVIVCTARGTRINTVFFGAVWASR